MKILLADQHEIVREGLRACLEATLRYQVVGAAEDGNGAIELAKKLGPDVVLIDQAVRGVNGIEAARQIAEKSGGAIKIVIMSIQPTRECIVETFRAGASGYISKSCAVRELFQALDEVAEGRTYLSPSLTGLVMEQFARVDGPEKLPRRAHLTPRERQIVKMLADGQSAKRIASSLDISHKTVHAIRAQVMGKIDAKSLVDLVKYALRNGLTRLE